MSVEEADATTDMPDEVRHEHHPKVPDESGIACWIILFLVLVISFWCLDIAETAMVSFVKDKNGDGKQDSNFKHGLAFGIIHVIGTTFIMILGLYAAITRDKGLIFTYGIIMTVSAVINLVFVCIWFHWLSFAVLVHQCINLVVAFLLASKLPGSNSCPGFCCIII